MSVGELTVSIIGDMTKLSSTLLKVQKDIGSMGSSFSSMGSKLNSTVVSGLKNVTLAAAATGTAVGVGLVASGVKATNMFVDFEKSVSNAASVTGLTGEAFNAAKANISAVAQELGQKTAFSSSQAADALYNLASAGVDVSAITSDKLIPVLSLASGTQYDLADTTAIVTSTLSQFGMQFESAGRVSDVFAKSAALSQASMDKLKYSMAQVGTIASSAGLSLEDTTAALSKMYDAGMDGSSAGTGLKGVIASLMAPTSQATGIFKTMGLTLSDISPASNKFSDIIAKLKEHGLDSTKAFQLFGREGAPAIMALVNQTDGLKTMTDQLKEAGGAAQTMADQQLDTLSGSLDSLSGSIENIWINVGQALAPTIRTVADSLNGMMPDIQNFVTGAIESFVAFVSRLGSSVSSIKTIGSTVFDVFNNIFKSLSGGSGGAGNSIADFINGMMSRISGIVLEAAPIIQNAVISVIGFFQQLVTGLQPTWTNIKTIATGILNVFKALFSGMADNSAANSITGVINTISSVLAGLSTVISNALVSAAPTIKSVFSTIADAIKGIDWAGIFNTLKAAFDTGMNAIKSVDWSGIFNTLKNAFNSGKEAIENVDWNGIFTKLQTAFDTGKEAISNFVKDLSPTWDNLKSSFDSVKGIIEIFTPVWDTFKTLIKDNAGPAGLTAVSVAAKLVSGTLNILSGALAKVLKFFEQHPALTKFVAAIVALAVGLAGLSAIAGLISTGIAAMGLAIGTALGGAIVLFSGFGSAVVAGLGLVLSPIGLVIGAIVLLYVAWKNNWGNIQGITASAVVFIKNNWNKFTAELGRLPGVASAALTTLKNIFLVKLDAIIGDINDWGRRQTEKYNQAVTSITTFKNRAIAAWAIIKTAIKAKLTELINDIQAWITSQIAKYNNAIAKLTAFKTQAIARWTEIKAAIKAKLNELIADLQAWIASNVAKLNNMVAKYTAFKTRVIARWTEIKTAIKTKLDEIITEIKNAASRVGTALNGMINTIKNKVSDFKSAGKALIQGLIDGIEDKISGVKNAMSKVTNAANNFLTHSPAKEGPFKKLPTFDPILYDPLMATINKTKTLAAPLSDALSKLKTPINSSLQSGLTSMSTVSSTTNNVAGDTLNLGGVTLANNLDVQALFAQFERYTANKRRAGGYRG